MACLYDTVAEYDAEIAIVRAQIHKSMSAEEFWLNTSQSNQRVRTASLDKLTKYLDLLCASRASLVQRSAGAGVTSIQPRRTY